MTQCGDPAAERSFKDCNTIRLYYNTSMPKQPRVELSAEEKRRAAKSRLENIARKTTKDAFEEYGLPLGASLFSVGRSKSRSIGRSRTHTLGPIRITAELAKQLADHGNDLGLNPSETVRRLLREALEGAEKRRKRRRK